MLINLETIITESLENKIKSRKKMRAVAYIQIAAVMLMASIIVFNITIFIFYDISISVGPLVVLFLAMILHITQVTRILSNGPYENYFVIVKPLGYKCEDEIAFVTENRIKHTYDFYETTLLGQCSHTFTFKRKKDAALFKMFFL